jgi:hypothetical protein
VLGGERYGARQIVDDDRQLLVAVFLVESRHGSSQRPVKKLDLTQAVWQRLHPDAATIFRIPQALGTAGPFEPINHCCHRAGSEAGVGGQASGRGRSGQAKEVETFEVRGVQSD